VSKLPVVPCELAAVPQGALVKLASAWYAVTLVIRGRLVGVRHVIHEGDRLVLDERNLQMLDGGIKVRDVRWPHRASSVDVTVPDPLTLA